MNGSSKKRLALFVLLDLSPNQHVYFMAIFRPSFGVAKHIRLVVFVYAFYKLREEKKTRDEKNKKNRLWYSILEMIYISALWSEHYTILGRVTTSFWVVHKAIDMGSFTTPTI
jgi:hypothetical protein